MKIGLITIHYANSYGGCLQALASQVLLSRYGEVLIIDYKSPFLASSMRLLRFGRHPRSALHVIKDLCRILPRRRLIAKFRSFMNDYYHLTHPCNTDAKLAELNDQFDVFICGSDQIWNPVITGGLDPHYLLDFVANKPRVSFSTSAGSHNFSATECELMRKEVSRFVGLAFREDDLVDLVSNLVRRDDVMRTLDPTLLLSKEEWYSLLGIVRKVPEHPYIFVYTLKKDNLLYNVVKRIAERFKLKIIAVDQDPFLLYRADLHIRDASPSDYVSLIANAAFVVTNSFHGTAFAVNFGVPFITITPEHGLNRIVDLLESVGLEQRLVADCGALDDLLEQEVDFDHPHRMLAAQRKESIAYLKAVIS